MLPVAQNLHRTGHPDIVDTPIIHRSVRSPVFLNPRTIKAWATGDGNADKAKMMRFCKLRWKTEPVDDNEADATHIFMYYVKKFKL